MRKLSGGRRFLFLLASVQLAGATATGPALADEFRPHSLRYELTLASSDASSGVTAVTGTLSYDLQDLCDAWSWQYKMDLEMHANGVAAMLRSSSSAWEAKDGLSFSFFDRTQGAPGETETVKGEAHLEGPGQAGLAVLDDDETRRLPLPAGTLFPMQAARQLVEAADAGQTFVYQTLFQGDEDSGLFEASTVILPPLASAPEPALRPPLSDQPAWPVTVGYFYGGDSEAQYEVEMWLYPNGVALPRLLDFGSFALRARLLEAKVEPAPDC